MTVKEVVDILASDTKIKIQREFPDGKYYGVFKTTDGSLIPAPNNQTSVNDVLYREVTYMYIYTEYVREYETMYLLVLFVK